MITSSGEADGDEEEERAKKERMNDIIYDCAYANDSFNVLVY